MIFLIFPGSPIGFRWFHSWLDDAVGFSSVQFMLYLDMAMFWFWLLPRSTEKQWHENPKIINKKKTWRSKNILGAERLTIVGIREFREAYLSNSTEPNSNSPRVSTLISLPHVKDWPNWCILQPLTRRSICEHEQQKPQSPWPIQSQRIYLKRSMTKHSISKLRDPSKSLPKYSVKTRKKCVQTHLYSHIFPQQTFFWAPQKDRQYWYLPKPTTCAFADVAGASDVSNK